MSLTISNRLAKPIELRQGKCGSTWRLCEYLFCYVCNFSIGLKNCKIKSWGEGRFRNSKGEESWPDPLAPAAYEGETQDGEKSELFTWKVRPSGREWGSGGKKKSQDAFSQRKHRIILQKEFRLKMDERSKCETRFHQNPRGEHRQHPFWTWPQ